MAFLLQLLFVRLRDSNSRLRQVQAYSLPHPVQHCVSCWCVPCCASIPMSCSRSPAPLQACFGSVASVGQVEGYIPWGASVQVKAAAHGVWLDLLPDSWQEAADLQKVS